MKKVSTKSKRRLMTFGIFSIIAIVYFCVTFIGYIYNYVNLTNEEKVLKQELSTLQEEKKDLKIEIQKLNDPAYVIRYAKEKFLFSSEGEFVIKLKDPNPVVAEDTNDSSVIPIIVVSIVLFLGVLIIFRIKNKKKI